MKDWRLAASAALFALTGLINLIPVVGVTGAPALGWLYGLEVQDPNLLILLQHRALLLGLVGTGLLIAAWAPGWRKFAGLVGLVSMGSYVPIALIVGGYNAALAKVVAADALAIAGLCLALWMSGTFPSRES